MEALELVGCLQHLTCGQVGRDALGKPFTSAFVGWCVTVALLLIFAHTALAKLFRNFKNLAHLDLVRIA